jgi:hydroxyacylglutathione hydrolase
VIYLKTLPTFTIKKSKMSNHIIRWKRIGYSNSVLILNGENSVLVDTGVKGNMHQFDRFFRQNKIKPADIKLIILTHTHYDHTGNLSALQKMTGAHVMVHRNEFENLKQGYIPIPPGQRFYTRFISKLGKTLVPRFASPEPFVADLINDDEFDLSDYGIHGKIISTPGHSSGSQSVKLGKSIICGDVFMNLIYGSKFPHFAEDAPVLLDTWKKIFDLGIEEIYPAHGKKMKVEEVYPVFEKWNKKLGMDASFS